MSAWRSNPPLLIHAYGLLLIPVVIGTGIAAVYSPAAAIGASLIVMSGVSALVFIKPSSLLVSLLGVISVLIVFPAFLPRVGNARQTAAVGGALDLRALSQLAVFAMVAVIGCWLWMIAGAGLADLGRFPINILVPYIALTTLSLMYTPEIGWPAYGLFKLVTVSLLLALVAKAITTVSGLKRLINVTMGAIVVVLAMYWLDIVRGAAGYEGGRYTTSWLHSNHATLMAVTLLLILTARYLASSEPGSRFRIPLMGFAAIMALITASKTALGGAAFALAVTILVIIVRKPSGASFARILLLSAGALGVLAYFLANNLGIVAHLLWYEEAVSDSASLTGRVPVWHTAISDTLGSPFTALLGHGYLSGFAIGLQGTYWTAQQAHNSFIQTFFDLGAFGVVLVSLLYLMAWAKALRAFRLFDRRDPRWARALELLAVLTLYTVVSMAQDIMGGTVESRTIVFLLILCCIDLNLRVSPDVTPDAGGRADGERKGGLHENPARP